MYALSSPFACSWLAKLVLALTALLVTFQLLLLCRGSDDSSQARFINDLASKGVTKVSTLWSHRHEAPAFPPDTSATPSVVDSELEDNASWTWNVSRDSHNPALTHEQCHAAFPKLYYQINQSASHWTSTGHTISDKDINLDWCKFGCMRLMIYENELRVIESKDIDYHDDHHDTRRAISALSQIHRALQGASAAGKIIPNIEFSISVRDYIYLPEEPGDTRTIWSFDRKKGKARDDRLWLMPDFNFWSWERVSNSYSDARRRVLNHDSPMAEKIPKIAWRGDSHLSRLRTGYLRKTEGKPWADNNDNWINIDEFCSYLFNAYIEGMAWSGRLKYLLACDSVTVIHELLYITYYHHLLVPSGPNQNYMSVGRRWSNLEEKIQYFLNRPNRTQNIIRNAVATFRDRYITPAAEACYWRELFRAFARVSFDPEPFEASDGTGTARGRFLNVKTARHLRGMAYELWLTMDLRKPPPEQSQEQQTQEQPDPRQPQQEQQQSGEQSTETERSDGESEEQSSERSQERQSQPQTTQQWSTEPHATAPTGY